MMLKTHLAFALLIGLLSYYYFNINFLFFITLMISAMIPDIDSSKSFVGRKLPFIEFMFYHRGFFHSLWFLILVFSILFIINKLMAAAFLIGFLSHLFLDSLNRSGISPFYPLKFKLKGGIRSGSLSDHLLFFSFIVLSLLATIGHFGIA